MVIAYLFQYSATDADSWSSTDGGSGGGLYGDSRGGSGRGFVNARRGGEGSGEDIEGIVEMSGYDRTSFGYIYEGEDPDAFVDE